MNRNILTSSLLQKEVDRNDWDKWERDYTKKHKYYQADYNEDVPVAEEESEIETAIMTTAEYIQTDIDGFLDLLYNPAAVENLDEKDIELMLDSVGRELTDLLTTIKEANLGISLEQECRAPVMMGLGI